MTEQEAQELIEELKDRISRRNKMIKILKQELEELKRGKNDETNIQK